MKKWIEHYREIFGGHVNLVDGNGSRNQECIDATEDMAPDIETMCEISSRREIKKAITSLKLGTLEVDNISTEMLREGSETTVNILYTLFKEVW